MKRTGYFTRAYRITRIATHVLYAVIVAALIYPWLSEKARIRVVRRWSAGMMRILNIQVHVTGVAPDLSAQNVMLVANHVSWLDIYALNSVRPARFVSKSEVRDWPVAGWLAYKTGTFFIDRAKRHDTARVNHDMSAALNDGGFVAVFPEGTTSNGTLLRAFHASLLQPAVHSQSRVWPVAIRYAHADGSLNTAPAYADDISFGESLAEILNQPVIHVELAFSQPIAAHGKTRRELARQAEQTIASALSLAIPGKESGIPADPQAALQIAVLPTDSHCPAL